MQGRNAMHRGILPAVDARLSETVVLATVSRSNHILVLRLLILLLQGIEILVLLPVAPLDEGPRRVEVVLPQSCEL